MKAGRITLDAFTLLKGFDAFSMTNNFGGKGMDFHQNASQKELFFFTDNKNNYFCTR